MPVRDKELREQFKSIDERLEARFDQLMRTSAETRHVLALELLKTREELTAKIDAVDQTLDGFRDETHTNFDHVFGRFDRLETEYYAISAGLQRVEKRFSEDA